MVHPEAPISCFTFNASPPVRELRSDATGETTIRSPVPREDLFADMPQLEPMDRACRRPRTTSLAGSNVDVVASTMGLVCPRSPSRRIVPSTHASSKTASNTSTEGAKEKARRSSRVAEAAIARTTLGSTFAPASPSSRHGKRAAEIATQSPLSKRLRLRKKSPPNAIEADLEILGAPLAACCICMCEPDHHEASKIDGCDHKFCFSCIGTWSDRENSCPLCKARFTKIERIHPRKKIKGDRTFTNSKRVKQRDQRSDVVSGAALEAILQQISSNESRLGRFIFSRMGTGAFHPTVSVDGSMFDSDEDEDTAPDFMTLFMRSSTAAQQRRNALNRRPQNLFPYPTAFFGMSSTIGGRGNTTTSSYALNASDSSAGRAATNPLEIDDSDDDDVEVVQVTRSL
jgi:hypothetical protein